MSNSVLIVDDDPKILELLELSFHLGGFTTHLAADGEKALVILEKERIDVVILDIALEGLDGYEVCRQIKSNPETNKIPVIFLTSRAQEADLLKGEEAGGDYYLSKPFLVDELLTITTVALNTMNN